MANNKLIIRPRVKIFKNVDDTLHEFASTASAEVLSSAVLAGLRLWINQKEGIHKVLLTPAAENPTAMTPPVVVMEKRPNLDATMPALDLSALDLLDVKVHVAEGG